MANCDLCGTKLTFQDRYSTANAKGGVLELLTLISVGLPSNNSPIECNYGEFRSRDNFGHGWHQLDYVGSHGASQSTSMALGGPLAVSSRKSLNAKIRVVNPD